MAFAQTFSWSIWSGVSTINALGYPLRRPLLTGLAVSRRIALEGR